MTTGVVVSWRAADGDATVVEHYAVIYVFAGTVDVTVPPVVTDNPAVVISLRIAVVADVTGEGNFLANYSFGR